MPQRHYYPSESEYLMLHKVFKANLSVDLTLSNATTTNVPWTDVVSDDDGVYVEGSNNEAIYFPSTGYYFLVFNTVFDTGTVGTRYIDIRLNNTSNETQNRLNFFSGDKTYVMAFCLIKVTSAMVNYPSGSYVQCRVWQNNGGTLKLKNWKGTSFQYYKVRDI